MTRPTEAELAEIVKRSGARMVKRHDLDRGPNVLREALPMARQKVKRVRKVAAPSPSEHAEQVAVIQWFDLWGPLHGIDRRLLFAIPNAGAGAQARQSGRKRDARHLCCRNLSLRALWKRRTSRQRMRISCRSYSRKSDYKLLNFQGDQYEHRGSGEKVGIKSGLVAE